MQRPAALRDVPAVAAVRAVREAARGRRPRQAEAGVLLRRGAPAVRRRAEGAARQDRAGRAADPLQGRRRLLRHAEPARRARHRARPARQPRAARAARLHAARPEGGEGRGRHVPAEPGLRHREAITELGVGEALVSFLDDKGGPSRSSALRRCRRRRASARSTPSAARASWRARSPASTTRRSIASRPTKC